jgi:phosphoglycerate kinase
MAKTLADLDFKDKRVLVRVDFNVPLDENRQITSDARIRAALPTIRAILDAGGRPVLMSHLGRPKGQVVESMRLRPAGERLGELLNVAVRYCEYCIGDNAINASKALQEGEVLVIENLRFHADETVGDKEFAAALAKLGDVYVNDAFGTAHRAHASVAGVPRHLPSAAGLLMEKELAAFAKLLRSPDRPVLAILGGAKVSDKLPVILNLLDKVDSILVGGAMAYTFLRQQGLEIGNSLCEDHLIDAAAEACAVAEAKGVKLLLPVDHVCAAAFEADAECSVHGPEIPAEQMALDIGPETVALYCEEISKAKTIVWNGPMGVFEMEAFRKGTEAVARAVAKADAWTLVGGGDSVAAAELLGITDAMDHVSTGGGASLELLEGKQLPGVTALESN